MDHLRKRGSLDTLAYHRQPTIDSVSRCRFSRGDVGHARRPSPPEKQRVHQAHRLNKQNLAWISVLEDQRWIRAINQGNKNRSRAARWLQAHPRQKLTFETRKRDEAGANPRGILS